MQVHDSREVIRSAVVGGSEVVFAADADSQRQGQHNPSTRPVAEVSPYFIFPRPVGTQFAVTHAMLLELLRGGGASILRYIHVL